MKYGLLAGQFIAFVESAFYMAQARDNQDMFQLVASIGGLIAVQIICLTWIVAFGEKK